MRLVCTHDPSDPNHLICESKDSPMAEWFRKRYRQFYCVGPTCPPHKAYTHLWVDLALAIVVVSLLLSTVVLIVKARRGDEVRRDMLEEQIGKAAGEALRPPESTPPLEEPLPSSQAFLLQGRVLYFSSEGEQLGRGPWPPEVGEVTKVKVFFDVEGVRDPSGTLKKRFNNVSVRGYLSQGAQWTGFAPLARRLSYVPEGRAVEWYPESNSSVVFEVAVRPTVEDIAQGSMVVFRNLSLRGSSSDTGRVQEIAIPDLVLSFQ